MLSSWGARVLGCCGAAVLKGWSATVLLALWATPAAAQLLPAQPLTFAGEVIRSAWAP